MTRLAGLVPALEWLPRYDRRWLRADLVGGVSAGAVVIPQAMAYATIADLPPEVGLYTCMLPMVVYALLGGSRTLSVSTTSTVATLTGSTLLAAGVATESSDPARDLATLTLLVGLILLAARILRLGALIDNISEATVTGIKVGVGLTVALGQVPKLLGISGDAGAGNVVAEVRGIIDELDAISWTTAAFSALTIALLLVLRRAAPAVPGPLVAVAAGIALVAFTDLDVALVDPVPSGLPTPVTPSFDRIGALAPGAFAVAIMCFLETAAVAKAVRRGSEPPIDNDQELTANGLSCVAGAFFRAMPSAGGFSQTAINQRAGAATQLSELVTVALAVSCALFLGDVLSDLPEATLASLVLIAVLGLLQPAEFVRFWRLSKPEFWVAVITALTGLFVGMLAAVLVGVLLTLFLVIWELDHIGVTELQPTVDGRDVQVAADGTAPAPGVLVLRIDGPLYTANVRTVNRRILAAIDGAGDVDTVVLDLAAVPKLSVTTAMQFADLEQEITRRGVTLWLAAVPPQTMAVARQMRRFVELEQAGQVHPTALAALRAHRPR